MKLTPEQYLKRHICQLSYGKEMPSCDLNDPSQIEKVYETCLEERNGYDCRSDLRESGIHTDLPCEFSRHYESDSVARQMDDGTWIGWTYWHGGGKHGEPRAIDWMEDAYYLNVTEKQEMVTVRTFEKK